MNSTIARMTPEQRREHWREARRKYHERYPLTYHRRMRLQKRLRRDYGMSLRQFVDVLRLQDGKCAICEVPLTWQNYRIDHDHKTRLFRGILCNNCNLGIGQLRDEAELLRRAVLYLGGELCGSQ